MIKNKILQTVFLLITLIVISGTASAQCADFESMPEDNYFSPVTTPEGWTGYWFLNRHEGAYHYDRGVVFSASDAYTMPYISSPVFYNGCNSINFKYKRFFGFPDMTVEIKQGNATVWNRTITSAPDEWTEFSIDNLNIEGSVQLVITSIGNPADDWEITEISLKDICITANAPVVTVPAHNFQFNVPKDATVFVGDKDQTVTVAGNYLTKHYVPFTPKPEVHIAETDTSRIWYYDLPAPKNASGGFNYRVTRAGKAPHVGLFKPKAGTTVESDTLLIFTDAQLSARNAKNIDHDVNSLNGRNVADMFININAQGYLTLPLQADTAFQLIHTRNWQAIDTDVNNYFIEPDFHYTVVDENGQPSSSVITIDDKGLIKPVGAGTAIVLVDYDAMLCHHTTNVVPSGVDVKTNPAFFSASWGENTAVFVVSVAQPEANITSNMNLNAYWAQDGTDKTGGVAIDAEHDVLYFEADKGSFHYTFKPEGVTQVLVATPTVGATIASYSDFRADSVTANTDGSYTVRLGFGRNIVKLVSASGANCQVITAKPVTYTVSNLTHPDEMFSPGDEVSVVFNTLYHPSNKMSGIYNMSAGIQYTGESVNFPLILGPGQYTFASRAQEYKMTIPANFAGNEYVLTNGVIKVKGFGSYYGAHRKITIQSGVNPNLSASVREAYFGSIPDIHIKMKGGQSGIADISAGKIAVYPNPFTEFIIVEAKSDDRAAIYDISGKQILTVSVKAGSNCIETSALGKGVYVLKMGSNTVKIVK